VVVERRRECDGSDDELAVDDILGKFGGRVEKRVVRDGEKRED
jgi:hypothetical protein